MKKIITLFQRNYEGDRLVRDEVTPGAEWVINGEGASTRKYDGQCAMQRDGVWYRRHELKPGKVKPPSWEPADEVDAKTGKQMGWIPVGEGPEDRYFREAIKNLSPIADGFNGTFELVGPKVQGGVERDFDQHILIPHLLLEPWPECPRTYKELRAWLSGKDIEGMVWHHPDGRMVKIKKKDFGLKRTPLAE